MSASIIELIDVLAVAAREEGVDAAHLSTAIANRDDAKRGTSSRREMAQRAAMCKVAHEHSIERLLRARAAVVARLCDDVLRSKPQ